MSTVKTTNVDEILQRLKFAKKFNTWKEVADFLGESEATISIWRKRNSPSAPEKILFRCGELSPQYLLTGEGPMLSRKPSEYGLLENTPGEGPITTGTKEDKEAPPASGVDYTEVEWMIRETQMLREMLEMSKSLVAVLQRENASLLESASAPVKKKQQL